MRRLAVLLIIVLILIGYGVRLNYNDRHYESVQYASMSLRYFETTLKGLEDRSSNVVKGRLGDDAKTAYATWGGLSPFPVYSVVSLKITDVILGNLKVGEVIKIIEPYYIDNRVLWTYSNYLPSIANREYIFFLGNQAIDKAPKGCEYAYFVIHDERGRYLVPSEERDSTGHLSANDYKREDLSLGEMNIDLYMQLYQDVIDAYIKTRSTENTFSRYIAEEQIE